MKILVMGNNDHMGGLIIHYTTLVRYLYNSGFEIFCISINDKGAKVFAKEDVSEVIIPYKPANFIQKLNKYIKLSRAITKAKAFKPDIFIATGLGNGYAKVANCLPKSTFRLFEEVHFDAGADKLRLKMVNSFDAVAPQTYGMIEQFKKNVSGAIPVNHLPCFAKDFQDYTIKDIPGINNEIRLAYFGRLAWNKGLKEFINATSGTFKNNSSLVLDIYGKGPEIEIIKKEIANHDLQDQIKLKGPYEDSNFPEIIGGYHAIIIPSIANEGLPLIVLEAMCFGRPIFTTEIGAMPEIAKVNREGMLISSIDSKQLSINFHSFLEKITEGSFNAKAINGVYKENFSNEAFYNTWLSMLKNPVSYFKGDQNKLN